MPTDLIAWKKSQQNKALLDPWSVVHFGVGLAVGLMGIRMKPALVGAVLYEFAEAPLERAEFGKNLFNVSKPETMGNAVLDVVVFALGVRAGHRFNAT